MVLHTILSILSFLTAGIIYYFTGMYNTWYLYTLLIIIIPILYVVFFGLYVLIVYLTTFIMKSDKETKKPRAFFYFMVRQTAIELTIILNSKIYKTGLEKLPTERCLIVSNHQSIFDPMVAMKYAKNQPLICISKPENFKLPICGKYIHKAGFIPVNRDNDFEAIKSITKATKFIKDDLASIYICPEGTRSPNEDKLLEFQAGSFKIAYKAKCPIVITSMANTKNIRKYSPFKRTKVYFDLLEVLNYEDYKDKTTVEIAKYSQELIENKLKERK